MTAALRAGESYLVHGLGGRTESVARVCSHVASLGKYGPVSIDLFGGSRLPYIDSLVNLVVAEDLGQVPMGEVMRVLCPNGVACVGQNGSWRKIVKPRPDNIDEWTHYLHEPSNNAVAHDTAIDHLAHLQWLGGPKWSRHHDHMSSSSAIVSASGRCFYVFDEAPATSIQLPSTWFLIARDAFNGKVLWKRPIGAWHTQIWRLKSGPVQLPRRLVAVGDEVYATLALGAPVTAPDAATGETIRTYAETRGTEEILCDDGTLYSVVNRKPTVQAPDPKHYDYHAHEGERIDSPPTVWAGRVLFGSADGYVYCLTAADGALIWRFRAAPMDRRLLAFEQVESVWPVHGNVLVEDGVAWCVAGRSMFLDGGLRLLRLNPKTGKKLSEHILDDRDPESSENLQTRLRGLNMPVALPDILSSDGRYTYMRSQRFDKTGRRLAVDAPMQNIKDQQGEGAHLFSPTGFLDEDDWHRSYWVYGLRWASGAGGYFKAGRFAPAGRMLVFDDTTVYRFRREPDYFKWTTAIERHLFASAKAPDVVRIRPADKRPGFAASRPVELKIATEWTTGIPLYARAMALADRTLFVAGPPDIVDEGQALQRFGAADAQAQLAAQARALSGQDGALLWVCSADGGGKLAEYKLEALPVWDGMAAIDGRLFVATKNGDVRCWAARAK